MNAKDEFIDHTGNKIVSCAIVYKLSGWMEKVLKENVFVLHKNYNTEKFMNFLKSIDFDYDSGYGGQELAGTMWFEDGTWSTRGEYNGSEWWEHHECPCFEGELDSVIRFVETLKH